MIFHEAPHKLRATLEDLRRPSARTGGWPCAGS